MKQGLLDQSCVATFDKAIKYELGHFYLYTHLANAMQTIGYFGAQEYFLAESKEEVQHYQKHIDFINDLGNFTTLPTLVPEKVIPKTLEQALKLAYDNELDLLEYYRTMYNEEGKEYPEISDHLMFYLKTQREAVGFYGDMLARLSLVKDDSCGILLIDKELKKLA